MNHQSNRCPLCNGHKSSATTTFTAELGFGVVVVRHVPATVCEQCGAEWLADTTADNLERLVTDAKKKHSMIEVAEYANIEQPLAS